MKYLAILFTSALLTVGCGAVSHDELQTALDRSQEELRSEVADGDVASLECSLNLGAYSQAAQFCQRFGAYCNVVQAYENHCLREGDGVELLPPVRGVGTAVRDAAAEFNRALESRESGEEGESTPESSTTTPETATESTE